MGKVAAVPSQLPPSHPHDSTVPMTHSSKVTKARNGDEQDARHLGFFVRRTQQDPSFSASGATCDSWQETEGVLPPHLPPWTQCTRPCHPATPFQLFPADDKFLLNPQFLKTHTRGWSGRARQQTHFKFKSSLSASKTT